MADKKSKQKADGGNGKSAEPVLAPRLHERYVHIVRPKLVKEFQLRNIHEAPMLTKIVLNVGIGEAPKNAKLLDAAVAELGAITGQRPVVTRARKAISNFSLRAGMAIGASVTLRRSRMWEFLDRFVTLTVPRIRDFRGLQTRSFDGRG